MRCALICSAFRSFRTRPGPVRRLCVSAATRSSSCKIVNKKVLDAPSLRSFRTLREERSNPPHTVTYINWFFVALFQKKLRFKLVSRLDYIND